MSVNTVGNEIAGLLGADWEWDGSCATLLRKDGLQIVIRQHPDLYNRWRITAVMTAEQVAVRSPSQSIPYITVAQARSANQIAGDILRRLLPVWDDLYAKLNQTVTETQAAKDRKDIYANSVLNNHKGLAPWRVNDKVYLSNRKEGSMLSGEIVVYDRTVYLNLRNIPYQLADKILTLLEDELSK